MQYDNVLIRNRRHAKTKDQRMFFVLEAELKNALRETAQANFVSESQFIRESVRRNINSYRKANVL